MSFSRMSREYTDADMYKADRNDVIKCNRDEPPENFCPELGAC
jgi:hypothetical protein